MRLWCWRLSSLCAVAPALLGFLPTALVLGEERILTPVELCSGDAYRLYTYSEGAALEIDLRTASGDWVSLRRAGAAPGWYGYNSAGREVSSADAPAKIEHRQVQGVEVVSVSSSLADGVTHVAEYVARPGYCAVVSRISAEVPPTDAHILRLAPRFDMDISRLPCYAFRDDRGILHTGTISSVASQRPSYIGTQTWGGPGCLVSSLDPTRAYLAFFNPDNGPLVAFVFFHAQTLWPGAHHFLQLFTGSANFLYAGFLDTYSYGEPVAFGLCARADGDLVAFETSLPDVLRDFDGLVRNGVVDLPAVRATMEARDRLERCAEAFARFSPSTDWLGAWRLWYACSRGRRALETGDGLGAITVFDLFAPAGAP